MSDTRVAVLLEEAFPYRPHLSVHITFYLDNLPPEEWLPAYHVIEKFDSYLGTFEACTQWSRDLDEWASDMDDLFG